MANEEHQEEMSFEDAFDALVNEDENPTEEPEEQIIDEPDNEPDMDEPEADTEAADEEISEQPRDDQGRFASPQNDELERYKQEAQQWQHRYNSDLGRQNALQRKIQEQQQLIEQLSKTQAPQGTGMSDNEWNTLKEDFPEIAQAMEARLRLQEQQHAQQIQRLEQQLQPIQQQAHVQYKNAQYQILENQHPDWRDIARSQEFRQWLNGQPHAVQQLVESDEAADAAYLIGNYKLQNAPQTNDELKQRRERQLRQGQTLSNRGGRQKSSLPPEDDFEAAFNYFADK